MTKLKSDSNSESLCRECGSPSGRKRYCSNQCSYRWHAKGETKKNRNLKSRHGLDYYQFLELVLEQGGRCAACGEGLLQDFSGIKGESRSCHIDHAHGCDHGGNVSTTRLQFGSCAACRRGILCYECNLALGYAKESPDRLRGLADYIERY